MQSSPASPYDPNGVITLLAMIFTAVGTVGAVVVALFGDWIRSCFFPPSLEIILLDPQGEGPVPFQDPNGTVSSKVRWYHLQVRNPRRWLRLTEIDVRILRLEEWGADGGIGWVTKWKGEAPIRCRNQDHFPTRHTVGSPVDFDICRIHDNGNLFLRPIIQSAGLQIKWHGSFSLKLTFQAKSAEVDSRPIALKIQWNGQWHEGVTEMQDYFKIQES